MEEPNFFGLSIAYDPYRIEAVETADAASAAAKGLCWAFCPLIAARRQTKRVD